MMKHEGPMDDETVAGILVMLKYCLQALAQPGQLQLTLFPEHVCKSEELALDYDHWYDCFRRAKVVRSASQGAALQAIEDSFGQVNEWSDAAVLMDDTWVNIRRLAQAALRAMNWPEGVPPPRAIYSPPVDRKA